MTKSGTQSLILTLIAFFCVASMSAGWSQETKQRSGAPYLLDVCAVSGRPLPSTGGEVLIISGNADASLNGREIRFCCKGCKARFEKDPKSFIPAVDKLMIADQTPRYPNMNCVVMLDEPMPDPRGPEANDCKRVVYKNRLVRLCCSKCVRRLKRTPDTYITALDAQAMKEQMTTYPLKTCVVTSSPLGENATSFMVGDRLVRTCCGGCKLKVEADPYTYIAKLSGKPKTTKKPEKIDGLPEVVHSAVMKKYPEATVDTSSMGGDRWSIRIRTRDGVERTLEVSTDGWILKDQSAK